ncbi:unnamed protein product [Closterium sp. NIES-53]
MASLGVLAFDHEGRPVHFDTWLDDLHLYLLSDSKDSVSLFDLASGAAPAPPATADTQALYDVVDTRYSSTATAALGRLLLPYLFPELSAFATVEDLVSHLRTSDTRYRATVHAEFLDRNQPPMLITLYFMVTRLLDPLRSVKDHFLSLDPTSLTVDLLEQHLLAAETSAVAVGAARGTPRPPFFEGCSPSPLAPSYASAAAANVLGAKDGGAASASAKHHNSKGKGSRGGGGGSGNEDLVSHLRTSDTRYRATVHAEFLDRNQPPMLITLYFMVTRLLDPLRSVKDHFLSLDPTSLTVDLLEQHLLAAETSAVAVGAARGTPRPPFFEGCSPSPLAPSYASAAAADVLGAKDGGAASASAKHHNSKGKGSRGGGGGSGNGGGGSSEGSGGNGGGGSGESGGGSGGVGGGGGGNGGSGGSGGGGTGGGRTGAWRGGSGGVQRQQQQRRSETPLPQQLREWLFQRATSRGSVSSPYVIRTGESAGQTCRRLHTQHCCFSRLDDAWRAEFGDEVELPRWTDLLRSRVGIFDLDFDAMYALSVSAEGNCYRCVPRDLGIAAAALGASESALPETVPTEALHTFTLDSGASRSFFHDNTTLTPLPAPVPVRLADPSGGPVVARSSSILPCPAVPTGSLSRWSLYTLATEPSQVAASAKVSAPGQVPPPCSCRLLSHKTLQWHHRLGHPSLPRLRGMHSRLLVSGLPRSLPLFPPSLAPPCLPCVEGRQRAAPHSSSFPPTTTPLQTLHMDVTDLHVLHLHFDRGGEFSSNLLQDICRGEGILLSFTLPDCPQHIGIAERRIGLVMEVAHTSMIHAAAPHFMWPFMVGYAAHQLNLWPRVSLPETSPTLRWTGKVGDTSVFRVWGSHAFARDTSADKLSARAIPCVFLGFVPDAPGWQFYHPTSCHVLPSQDVTFDESVPFYHLFPYRSAPLPPPPLFLAPGPPPVDPLPPQGPAPLGVSQVDPPLGAVPGEVAVDSGAARGTASGGAELGGAEPGAAEPGGAATGGAEPGGAETGGAEPGGSEIGGDEPEGVEPRCAESKGAEFGGAEPQGVASSGVSAGASPRLSLQQLREWLVRSARLRSGATGAGGAGAAGAGRAGVPTGAGVTRGTAATGPGGARTRGTGAARTGGVAGAGAGDPTESGAAGAGGSGAGGAGAVGAEVVGTGVGGAGAGGAGAGGAGVVDRGGAVRPRPYFVPLLQQVLGVPSSTGLTPPLLCPPPDHSQLPLQPASPLPSPSPYTEQSGGLTDRREPTSRPASNVFTTCRVPRLRPPPVPGTHAMALRPTSVPLRVPLPAPPESSLPEVPDPESDRACAASPTASRLLATADTDPSFESADVSALVAELLDFAAACRLDYATALVAESASASLPSVEGECALGTDVLEDRQEDFECLAAAVPCFASMLLALEGDPDAPDIPTPRSYAEAITGPYSSQWQAAMDAKMASWKSTSTYINEVPPPGVNIVDGMWIFRVKRPPGSPPAFKVHYVARGFYQQQGVDYFQTFSFTPKMTNLRVLLHVAAQRDYDLRRPVYGLHQAPHEWHDTLRTTFAALGFTPSTADPSLFLRTDTSLPPFYVLVYVDDLVFATADTEALTLVKSELQKRHTCTDMGELCSYLGLQITRDKARDTITLTQSHMVHQVLQRFSFQFSLPQPTPLSTSHSLSVPLSDKSVEPTGPYPELVGCLMYLMTCTQPDLAYPLILLARYLAPVR